ncbi:MAG: hypothetical protein ACRBN8_35940 [Nannocystales bacterium]
MWAWALVISVAGPPVLPPLPGESAPEAPEAEPAAPSKPTRAPDTSKPTPSKPAPAPADDPPTSAPPAEGTFSIPTTEPPPQPSTLGPAPAPAPAPAAPVESGPREDPGPTAAPRIGELPSSDELPAPAYPRLPPPARPPYRGTGLFIGAGVAAAVALTEQIIAHRLVKTRCIDPIGRGEVDTAEDVGDVFQQCAPGVLPALALRVHSDIGLLAAVGLAAAGGMTRGNADAYTDVFDPPGRRRTVAGLRIAGISLVGAGVVSWLTTGAAAWGIVGNCGTARCVNSGRLMGFITRDLSAAMVASGAGMLGFAETYRRRHDGYTRDRMLSIGPTISLQGAGMRIGGRF